MPHKTVMPNRVDVRTFECQMNEYDSARVPDVLDAGGKRLPPSDGDSRMPRQP